MLLGNTPWNFQNYTKDHLMGIGLTEGLLIAAIAILLFGGKKIPQLGRTLGESIKGFKEGMKPDPKDSSDSKGPKELNEKDEQKKS